MYKISQTADDQIYLELSGKLDAVAMRVLLDELLELTQDMKHGKMLYRINRFEMPSLEALMVEMRYIPRMFSLLSRIDRVAVLTDVEWIKTAAKVEGALLPGLDIATFGLNEDNAAQAYLDDVIRAA